MTGLSLLARMAEIQKEMQELRREDGFVDIRTDVIQVTAELFHEFFPDVLPTSSDDMGCKIYDGTFAGIKITACEVGI